MKNYPLLLLFLIISFVACKKENIEPDPVLKPDFLSPSPPILSPDFDWSNSTTISINGADVLLPWVAGAASTIPSSAMQEMTVANGWELYYNYIGYTASAYNQKYLIFHNKFTGTMRVFCYNSIYTSPATEGIFNVQLVGTTPTNMLHLTEPLGQGKKVNNPGSVHTNLSISNFSGFRPEWNCFDVPFSYDPDIDQSKKMGLAIYTDQRTVSTLTLTGTFNSESVGELVTTTNSNPLSGLVNSASKKGGEQARNWLKGKINDGSVKSSAKTSILSKILSNAPDLAQSLVQSGISSILSSFIGGFGTTSSSSQSISLTTEGKMNLSGQLITGTPGVINSINTVPLPGTDLSDGGFLSSNNNPFGSWGLTVNPVVDYDKQAAGSGRVLTQSYYTSVPKSNVVLNPATLAAIDHFDVSAELWFYEKYQGSPFPDLDLANNPGGATVQDLFMGLDNGEEMYRDAENIFYRNVRRIRIMNPYFDNRVVPLDGYVPGFVVKVTVTLYPKAPYNTDPVAMTRTYIPNYQ